jgi:serine/threonine protein phosphatase PrpC
VDESRTALRVAACSDRGQVRDRNEDAFAADPPPPGRAATHGRLFLVADGMGGHEAGEVASALARDAVTSHYYAAPLGANDDPLPALREALRAATRVIRERQAREPGERDMGTTCTALAVRGASFWIAHIGDSRAYRWRAGRLQQLTRDHNWAEELLAAGRIDPAEAARHMGRHMITRALGIDPEAQVDLLPGKPLEPADRLLLCSDGLSGVVGEEEIAAILATADLESAVASLVAAANQADGPDNITVVLIEARAT